MDRADQLQSTAVSSQRDGYLLLFRLPFQEERHPFAICASLTCETCEKIQCPQTAFPDSIQIDPGAVPLYL